MAAQVEDGDQLLVIAVKGNFDITLLDISMPGPGFIETMKRLDYLMLRLKF